MQRDQKVGLALGVLLIGAVAAFFFRHEPDPSARLPQLESAEAVDREIAEKRLTPYLPETPATALGEPSESAISDREEVAATRTGERKLPRWDELQSQAADPFRENAAGTSVPMPAPDPIPSDASAAADTSPRNDELTAAAPPAVETISATTFHEVQRGETLSSIAGKYLGSQARFQEIFAANADQLRDANDLQVGMKLRIPAKGAMKTVPVTRTNAALEALPEKPQSAPVFVPASTTAETPATFETTPPKPDPAPPAEPTKLKFTPAKRRNRTAPPTP